MNRLVLRAANTRELKEKVGTALNNGNGILKSVDIALWFDGDVKIIHFDESTLRTMLGLETTK